ncbi:MAG: ABC transporter substrate-binding protein, partial [Methyloceanibacter sp.]
MRALRHAGFFCTPPRTLRVGWQALAARRRAVRLGWRLRSALRVIALLVVVCPCLAGAVAAQALQEIRIAYLSQLSERPPSLSNLELPPENEGIAGGELAIADNNVTGRFLNQAFSFKSISISVEGDSLAAFRDLVEEGFQFIVLNVPPAPLLKMADAVRDRNVLLFNVGAPDDRLRDADCRSNLFHILPSRSMLTDGLAQYLVWKRWRDWFLVVGQRERDALFAEAVRRSARKFGARIVAERSWEYGPDARRTAQAEVPIFTQGVDYDVLVVADEIGEFGEYLAYRTWDPRPIAGTQGLTPTSWHWTQEQWGGVQLQNRFTDQFGRRMTALDYQLWSAIRVLGEAATRTNASSFEAIDAYIRSDGFE